MPVAYGIYCIIS